MGANTQNHISPGVYTKIIDLSYYLQEVPGTTGFIPFFSRRYDNAKAEAKAS